MQDTDFRGKRRHARAAPFTAFSLLPPRMQVRVCAPYPRGHFFARMMPCALQYPGADPISFGIHRPDPER